MAVGANQFALKETGKWLLQDDGTWSIGPACCCCGNCDEDAIAGSYSVAFAGSVDFDYAGMDTNQSCGGLPYYMYHPGFYWDYVIFSFYGSPYCDHADYGFGEGPPNGDITVVKQANGKYIFIGASVYNFGNITSPCYGWIIFVHINYCLDGAWHQMLIYYKKRGGDSPAGEYVFGGEGFDFDGVVPDGLTCPTTITLS